MPALVKPVFSLVLGYFVNQEPLTTIIVVGTGLILLALGIHIAKSTSGPLWGICVPGHKANTRRHNLASNPHRAMLWLYPDAFAN